MKQLSTDRANHLLVVGVDSAEEVFQEAQVMLVQENDLDVDPLSGFFFEIPNDHENDEGSISTVFSLENLMCYGYFTVVFFLVLIKPMLASNIGDD